MCIVLDVQGDCSDVRQQLRGHLHCKSITQQHPGVEQRERSCLKSCSAGDGTGGTARLRIKVLSDPAGHAGAKAEGPPVHWS